MAEPTFFTRQRAKSPKPRLLARLRGASFFALLLAGNGTGILNLDAANTARPDAPLHARTNINPGLLYWQAFSALPRSDEATQNELTGFADQLSQWSQGSSAGWSNALPANAESLLAPYARPLRLLQKARSSAAPCDWGADLADGPEMLIPDTRGLRELTRVSLLQAAKQLDSGRFEDSVDTLLASLALSRYFAQDHTLVAVMLQLITEGQVVDCLGAEMGRYPAAVLARFRTELSKLPPRVPVLESVECERSFRKWMAAQLEKQMQLTPGDPEKAYAASRAMLVNLFGGDQDRHKEFTEALDSASHRSVEGLQKLLNDLDTYYDQGRAIASADIGTLVDRESALVQLVENSTNPIARAAIPNFARARTRELSSVVRWAMLEASLAEVIGGEQAINQVLDPLSKQPFQKLARGNDVFELHCRAHPVPEINPVLRVMKGALPAH